VKRYRKDGVIGFIRRAALSFLYRVERAKRRSKQKLLSSRKADLDITFHCMCIKRPDYISASINCLNSIWEFMPGAHIVLWTDSNLAEQLEKKLKKFDRPKQLSIQLIEGLEGRWQYTKLFIISQMTGGTSVFSDVDMIWNGALKLKNENLFFLREFDMREQARFLLMLKYLEFPLDKPWYMLNVSVVSLKESHLRQDILNRSFQLYEKLENIPKIPDLGSADYLSIKRMTEQIALSLSIQEFDDFSVLKEMDSLMDGGLAESFYLGSSNGWV
jgi:hypothetical protein